MKTPESVAASRIPGRVLVAGLFHETHTFLEGTTPLSDFEIRSGNDLLAAEGDGSPLGGVLQVARESGWSVVPVIDMRAVPSATVEDQVVEQFWDALAEAVARERHSRIDGICLVLHGAMVSQSHADVEGEILERLREWTAGENLPVCGVLDLHGNFSDRMARGSDGMIAYRENPHTDAEAAARDAALLLDRLMRTGNGR